MANDFSGTDKLIAYWTFEPETGGGRSGLKDQQNNFYYLGVTDINDLNVTYAATNCPGDTDGGSYSVKVVNRDVSGTEEYYTLDYWMHNELMPGSSQGLGWKNKSFSVFGWFRLNELQPYSGKDIFYITGMQDSWAIGYDVNDDDQLFLLINDTKVCVCDGTSPDQSLYVDTWYFFCSTYNANRDCELYLYDSSGIIGSRATGTSAAVMNNSISEGVFILGAYDRLQQPYYNAMYGYLDAIGIWNGVLASADINSIHGGTYGS